MSINICIKPYKIGCGLKTTKHGCISNLTVLHCCVQYMYY